VAHLSDGQRTEGWGKSVVERLAADVQKAFPGIEGFFAPEHLEDARLFSSLDAGRPESLTHPREKVLRVNFSHRPVREMDGRQLPQGRCRYTVGAQYGIDLQACRPHPATLVRPSKRLPMAGPGPCSCTGLNRDLSARQGKAVTTTFKNVLPSAQSDLANEIIRDPYSLDFLTLRHDAAERELEEGLLAQPSASSLSKLGAGFAFVGQQVHLGRGRRGFFTIDLLFYHLKLRRYIVVDLKATTLQGRSSPAR